MGGGGKNEGWVRVALWDVEMRRKEGDGDGGDGGGNEEGRIRGGEE